MEHEEQTTDDRFFAANAGDEPSGLERIMRVSDQEIAAVLETAGQTLDEREAAQEREQASAAEQARARDVEAAWQEALAADPSLTYVVDAHPDVFKSGRVESAGQIELAKHLAHALGKEDDAEAQHLDVYAEYALDRVLDADDDVTVLATLDDAAERLGVGSERFAELVGEVEGFAPAAALAWASQRLANEQAVAGAAERAREAEAVAAERAKLDRVLAFMNGAREAEAQAARARGAEPRFDEAIAPTVLELLADAPHPASPEQAGEAVRAAVAAATELDRTDRVDTFLDRFAEKAFGGVMLDADRDALEREYVSLDRPEFDLSVIDAEPSRSQRQDAFLSSFDAHFAGSMERRAEVDRVAAKAEARAATETKPLTGRR
jgi:hypothetical protein